MFGTTKAFKLQMNCKNNPQIFTYLVHLFSIFQICEKSSGPL